MIISWYTVLLMSTFCSVILHSSEFQSLRLSLDRYNEPNDVNDPIRLSTATLDGKNFFVRSNSYYIALFDEQGNLAGGIVSVAKQRVAAFAVKGHVKLASIEKEISVDDRYYLTIKDVLPRRTLCERYPRDKWDKLILKDVTAMIFLDENTMAIGNDDGSVRILNLKIYNSDYIVNKDLDSTQCSRLKYPIKYLSLLPNNILAVATEDGTVRFWNYTNTQCIKEVKLQEPIIGIYYFKLLSGVSIIITTKAEVYVEPPYEEFSMNAFIIDIHQKDSYVNYLFSCDALEKIGDVSLMYTLMPSPEMAVEIYNWETKIIPRKIHLPCNDAIAVMSIGRKIVFITSHDKEAELFISHEQF